MEPIAGTTPRSTPKISEPDGTGLDSLQFNEAIHHLITVPNDNSSSFTALLELPPTQAMELLHSPDSGVSPARLAGVKPTVNDNNNNNNDNNNNKNDNVVNNTDKASYLNGLIASGSSSNLSFPSNSALIERASRFSIFATAAAAAVVVENFSNSPETPSSSLPSNSSANLEKVKSEVTETTVLSNPNSSSQPLISDPTVEENRSQRTAKRREREKKVKVSTKKSKSVANESCEDAEKLPYVHVRARRGQATDSHSLAERARREKINARMKLLQELVPGCNKISGTALVLDEIINHVQSLQRQVEFLSMRLAAVNPRSDFNLDSILAAESGSLMGSNFPSMVLPLMWPEVQVDGNRQQYQQQWHFDALNQPVWGREEDSHNFITSEHSLLSYDSSANSASLHSNHQLKMEL